MLKHMRQQIQTTLHSTTLGCYGHFLQSSSLLLGLSLMIDAITIMARTMYAIFPIMLQLLMSNKSEELRPESWNYACVFCHNNMSTVKPLRRIQLALLTMKQRPYGRINHILNILNRKMASCSMSTLLVIKHCLAQDFAIL